MDDSLFDAAPPRLTDGLNAQQLEAVTHRGGPLAVIAGPGTGKTRVITRRIASLIADDGVEPERVVALTFTVKAGEEMRSRLAHLLGGGIADRIYAGTFHGFSTRLIARFGDLASMRSDLTLTDSALERRLMRGLVRDAVDADTFPREAVAGGIEELVTSALAWRQTLAHDGVQPEEAATLAESWHTLAQDLEDEIERDAMIVEAQMFARYADLYQRFASVLESQGLASYDDQMLLPVRLLRSSELARTLARDAYRHFVVDEFQDVNHAQIRLLQSLAPSTAGREGPDLCVVGDDDQAIYGFRNATDLAFQTFRESWEGTRTVALTDNHRSSDAVLSAANHCIAHATTRAAPDKVVVAKRAFEPPAPDHVECIMVDHDQQIGSTIAAMIHAERSQNPELNLGTIAILCTSNADAGAYVRALELAGIPALSSLKHDSSEPAVDDLFAWVELLATPDSTHAAQRLLTRAPFAIDPRDVGAWARAYRKTISQSSALGADAAIAFIDFLRNYGSDDDRLRGFLDAYDRLDGATSSLNAGDALRRIVSDTGLAVADLPTPTQYARRVKMLAAIISFADDRARFFDPPSDLAAFWAYKQDLENDRFAIDDSPDSGPDDEVNAVRVLTAHGSKGLEFDTVYVARIGQHGFGSARDRGKTELPQPLRPGAADTRDAAERRQDEARRLFYVAITRAERRLVLVSKKLKGRGKTNYVQEITFDRQDEVAFVETSRADVLERAAQVGAFADASPLTDSVASVLDDRRTVHERVTADALVRAAEALHIAATKPIAPDELSKLIETLAESARASAASRALLERRDAAGLLNDERVAASLAQLYEEKQEGVIDPADPKLVVPQRSPLRLSFSRISLYNACPLCYFTKHIAGLDDAPTTQRRVGDIVHGTLETFYKQWRDADAEGRPTPGGDRLLTLARAEFEKSVNEGATLTTADWDAIQAMLSLTFDRLHDSTSQVEILEEKHTFGYEHLGMRHSIESRIDRMDRLPDGGVRIIDYKTGNATKKLLEPKPDDLQLGLYVLAAESIDGGPVTGVAEYWVMSEGARGMLAIESLKRDKIEKQIAKTIDGLLAGEFSWSKNGCRGICEPMRSHHARSSGVLTPGDSSPAAADRNLGSDRS